MAITPPESASKPAKRSFELRSWLFLILGMLIGGGITVALMHWLSGYTVADGFGQLLSGIAACVGVVVAAIGYRSWEATHRKTKQAEVAGEALIAAIDLYALLERTRKQYLRILPDDTNSNSDPDKAFRLYEALENDELDQRWHKVRTNVEAFLPNAAAAVLEKLWERRGYLVGILDGDIMAERPEGEVVEEFCGEFAETSIKEELANIKTELRRYALPE